MTTNTCSVRLPSAPVAASALTRSRLATMLQFGALGIISGTWGVHVPTAKSVYHLNETGLSLVLLAAALGGVMSLFVAGRVVGRLGVRRAVPLAGLVMCVLLAALLNWPSMWLLLPAMVLIGATMGIFDVAINAEGTTLESLGGRAVMGKLHGMFSLGGMLGAALGAWLLRMGVTPLAHMTGVGLVMGLLIVTAATQMLPPAAHRHDEAGDGAHFAWPQGALLVIGLLIFAGMSAEGVMYDWSVLYLKQELGLPQDRAALGYAAFSAAMAAARFGGDALRNRFEERLLLRSGALLACVSMAVLLLSAQPWIALGGFVLVGAGLALVVPMLYSAATRVPGGSRAASIAAASSIGYSGFLVGPPLIGTIAEAASLTWALGVVVVATLLLALGARYVPPRTPQS